MNLSVYGKVAELQGEMPWGSVLDAGTGPGSMPYREYPLEWVLRHLDQAGFRVVDARTLPIRYGESYVSSQIALCTESVGRMRDRPLASTLLAHIADVRERALALSRAEGGLRCGNDYLIVADV